MVKLFNDEYTLTTPKSGLTIEEIEDLSGVISAVSTLKLLTDAKVIAVRNLQSQHMCICCNKGHIVPMEDNPALGTCSTCPTTTLLSACELHTSAELVVISQVFRYELSAFGEQLANIAQLDKDETLTEIKLLKADKFDCQYNKNTIVSISRGH